MVMPAAYDVVIASLPDDDCNRLLPEIQVHPVVPPPLLTCMPIWPVNELPNVSVKTGKSEGALARHPLRGISVMITISVPAVIVAVTVQETPAQLFDVFESRIGGVVA